MAPPKPPLSTTTATHKHPHLHSHAQQHQLHPEEPLSPARIGRASGSATHPVTTGSSMTAGGSGLIPAASGAAPEVEQAVDRSEIGAVLLPSSSRAGCPLLAAETAVGSRLFPAAGLANSGDLELNQRRESTEGVSGFKDLHSGSPLSALPGNGGRRISAENELVSADHVFDPLPLRKPSPRSTVGVQSNEGQIWERGPAKVVREGSSIRAVFSSSPQGTSAGSGGPSRAMSSTNAGETQISGMMAPIGTALDAHKEGAGGYGNAPDLAGGPASHHASVRLPDLLGIATDLCQFRGGANDRPGDLQSLGGSLWEANIAENTSNVAAIEGEGRYAYSERSNGAKNSAKTDPVCPDLGVFQWDTVVRSNVHCPRVPGGMMEGDEGYSSVVERGGGGPRRSNAGSFSEATHHCAAAAALILPPSQTHREPQVSVWGRPPDLSKVGGWSPGYQEAFPPIRSNVGTAVDAQPRVEGVDSHLEAAVDAPIKKRH